MMAQGIPTEDTPRHIKEAIIDAVKGPLAAKYSVLSGMQKCREAVVKRYKMKYGVEFDPDANVGITAGCMEACMISVMAIVNPGDEVIMISPCFASHMEEMLACEGIPVFVNTDEANGWILDLEAVRKAITPKTKAIFMTNPSNPTGAVFPEYQIREVCDIAREHDLFILADETYDFLVYDKEPFFSFCQVPEVHDRLMLLGSSSKEYCMTGYRLGWVVTASDILNQLFKLHDATTICACTASQFGFIAAIDGPQDSVKTLIENMEKRRNLICERLDRIPHLFRYHKKPMGAYYILPKVMFPHENSIQATFDVQKATNVVTVPGIGFGPMGEGHLRFSFGGGTTRGPKGEDLINQAFDNLEEWGKQFL
ncbi:aminotransferase [Candidatus Peregrinibacteria bacterium CG_4_10_14_0_2_um_filter_43_11]|nr:MAG: aminotransferase [Candidatus Peregrinibacteria bacterium CG_4_10_14_0_2_um_filter_43_11]